MAADVNNPCDSIVAIETAIGEEGPTGLCEGRLTLVSGTPVSLADQTAKTTLYFTPFRGNRISLYNGTGWITHVLTEKSVSVPATTSLPFDVFAYSDSGTVTLECLTWTNDTTRATGVTTQDGVYVKNGATTRRYLGTCRTTAVEGQTEDSLANRLVWSYYNRVYRRLLVADATGHDYNTAVWRAWNNDTTILCSFVLGVAEDVVMATANVNVTRDAAGDGNPALQIYLNAAGVGAYVMLSQTDTATLAYMVDAIADPRAGMNYFNVYQYTFAGATAPTFNSIRLESMILG